MYVTTLCGFHGIATKSWLNGVDEYLSRLCTDPPPASANRENPNLSTGTGGFMRSAAALILSAFVHFSFCIQHHDADRKRLCGRPAAPIVGDDEAALRFF